MSSSLIRVAIMRTPAVAALVRRSAGHVCCKQVRTTAAKGPNPTPERSFSSGAWMYVREYDGHAPNRVCVLCSRVLGIAMHCPAQEAGACNSADKAVGGSWCMSEACSVSNWQRVL